MPESIARFLAGRRLAVAGVSRSGRLPANAIYRKLRGSGYEVFPINPHAAQVEGSVCYESVVALPPSVDGLIIATPPAVSAEVVRQAAACGIGRVWLHRALGTGSVSEDATRACRERGVECIAGGCPLMYCEPVDLFHRCLRWWCGRRRTVPR